MSEQLLFDSKRTIAGLIYTAGGLRPPRGLSGSSFKFSSDPIIQLAEVVARLGGGDVMGGTPAESMSGVGPRGPEDESS